MNSQKITRWIAFGDNDGTYKRAVKVTDLRADIEERIKKLKSYNDEVCLLVENDDVLFNRNLLIDAYSKLRDQVLVDPSTMKEFINALELIGKVIHNG